MFIRLTLRAFVLIPFASALLLCQQAQTPLTPDGKALFTRHCSVCHGENGEGVSAEVTIAGPALKAVHDPGIAMTAMEVGPSHMPSFAWVLSVAQMRAIADYVTHSIADIPLTGGNIAEGGTLFRDYCASCHTAAVRGGALAYTGINAPGLADKSAAIIAGTIRSGPGPMPRFPSSVLTDQQLASIVDYVKFVQHPPSPGGNPLHWFGPVAEGVAAWVVIFGLVIFTVWIERGGKG